MSDPIQVIWSLFGAILLSCIFGAYVKSTSKSTLLGLFVICLATGTYFAEQGIWIAAGLAGICGSVNLIASIPEIKKVFRKTD